MDDPGGWALAIGGFISAVVVAWLTAKGARGAAREQATATKAAAATARESAIEEYVNARIKVLLASYAEDREKDDLKIKALEDKVEAQGREIEELRGRFPKFRAEVRRLRGLLHEAGIDPGPWNTDLD